MLKKHVGKSNSEPKTQTCPWRTTYFGVATLCCSQGKMQLHFMGEKRAGYLKSSADLISKAKLVHI